MFTVCSVAFIISHCSPFLSPTKPYFSNETRNTVSMFSRTRFRGRGFLHIHSLTGRVHVLAFYLLVLPHISCTESKETSSSLPGFFSIDVDQSKET